MKKAPSFVLTRSYFQQSIEQWTNANFLTKAIVSIRINAVSCILYKIVAEIVKTEEPALRGIESHVEMVTFVNGNPVIFYIYHKKTLWKVSEVHTLKINLK